MLQPAQVSTLQPHDFPFRDFFPFVGILTINTPLTNCGHIGVYWTASADASNGYGYEVYVTSDWGRYRQGATAYGNSVRCVKEK